MRLDYFLISKNLINYVLDCRIISKDLGSSHAPIEIVFNSTFFKSLISN